MVELSVTPRAESDLLEIWLYTCHAWDPDQADRYIDHIVAGMKQLMNHPQLGANYAHVLPGYRRVQVKHHGVFYQVNEQHIVVIRVLHEDMDTAERLLD